MHRQVLKIEILKRLNQKKLKERYSTIVLDAVGSDRYNSKLTWGDQTIILAHHYESKLTVRIAQH